MMVAMPTKGKTAKTEMRSFGVGSRVNHSSDGFYNRKLYTATESQPGQQPKAKETLSENELLTKARNRIYAHTSEDMHELPDNSVHLMVTSPPYNVGKDYDDDLTFDEYRQLLRNVWQETHRVLAVGGRACINIANVGRKPYLPLNAIIATDMVDLGFLMRGEIIWNKAASAGTSCAWGSWMSASNPVLRDVHEYILVFSKGDYSRKKTDGQASTIDKDGFLEWTKSIWTFPAESAKRVKHPAPFPVELPSRLIELYTFAGDIVLDPFMGSGTTAVASQATKRDWVGYDTSEEYAQLATERINAKQQQELL